MRAENGSIFFVILLFCTPIFFGALTEEKEKQQKE